MSAPRWLVDEMLGRLARYLRFVGCDTVYARGRSDEELVDLARREGRILLTRDRELSQRNPSSSFLVVSPVLAEQWRAVRRAWPSVPTEPSFVRCSLCNGLLEERRDGESPPPGPAIPPSVRDGRGALYACRDCGHLYWAGSHTARIREQIAAWELETRP